MKTRTTAGVFGVLVGAVAFASPAFACSQNSTLTSGSTTGAAGGEVPVTGNDFNGPEKGGPVEITWGGVGGPLLSTAPGPSFTVRVRVPADAVPGVYFISAVQHEKANTSVAWARSVVIEVLAPPPVVSVPIPVIDVVTPPPATTPVSPVVVEPNVPAPVAADPVATVPSDAGQPVTEPEVAAEPVASEPGIVSGPIGSALTVTADPAGPNIVADPAAGPAAGLGAGPVGSGVVVVPGPLAPGLTPVDQAPGRAVAPSSAPRPGFSSIPSTTTSSGGKVSGIVGGRIGSVRSTVAAAPAPDPARLWGPQPTDAPLASDVWSGLDAAGADLGPALSENGQQDDGIPVGAALLGAGLVGLAGTGAVAGRRRLAFIRRPGTR